MSAPNCRGHRFVIAQFINRQEKLSVQIFYGESNGMQSALPISTLFIVCHQIGMNTFRAVNIFQIEVEIFVAKTVTRWTYTRYFQSVFQQIVAQFQLVIFARTRKN